MQILLYEEKKFEIISKKILNTNLNFNKIDKFEFYIMRCPMFNNLVIKLIFQFR